MMYEYKEEDTQAYDVTSWSDDCFYMRNRRPYIPIRQVAKQLNYTGYDLEETYD